MPMTETTTAIDHKPGRGAHRPRPKRGGYAPQYGPRSRPHVLLRLDQRTREAAIIRRTREELTTHVGGNPTATQAALIERCAMLTLLVALSEKKAVEAGGLTERSSREHIALCNSLTRALRQLGLKGEAPRGPSLAEYLAAKAAATPTEAA